MNLCLMTFATDCCISLVLTGLSNYVVFFVANYCYPLLFLFLLLCYVIIWGDGTVAKVSYGQMALAWLWKCTELSYVEKPSLIKAGDGAYNFENEMTQFSCLIRLHTRHTTSSWILDLRSHARLQNQQNLHSASFSGKVWAEFLFLWLFLVASPQIFE